MAVVRGILWAGTVFAIVLIALFIRGLNGW